MAAKEIIPNIFTIPLGVVNAFLLQNAEGLILIDTGSPGSTDKILAAVRELGRQPTDIHHILVTHCHPDHAGSLAEIKQITGAPAYMHPADATLVRQGNGIRPMSPAPGLLSRLLFWLFIRPAPTDIPPAEIEHELKDGDTLPVAGGIQVIHTPGHCAGQVAFLWPYQCGVLFAADAASNMMGLGLSLGYEELAEGKRSLAKLAEHDFDTACFGHGKAITNSASARFRKKWGKDW